MSGDDEQLGAAAAAELDNLRPTFDDRIRGLAILGGSEYARRIPEGRDRRGDGTGGTGMSAARVFWPDLGPADIEAGWQPALVDLPESRLTAEQVLKALALRHHDERWNGMPGRWVFLTEVQEATGQYGDVQRFDALAVGLVPSVGYARVVYEVKVSRSDWLRELRPQFRVGPRNEVVTGRFVEQYRGAGYAVSEFNKWDAALRVATEFWYAAPPRCILPSEVPEGCGLVEVRPWGADRELRARVVVKAPKHDTPNPGPEFWSAVIRRAARRSEP